MQILQDEIFKILSYVILMLISLATTYVINLLKQKGILAKLENHKAIIDMVVRQIEQTLKDSHGIDKLNAAKSQALQLLNGKGIKITDAELTTLIENAVKTMNDAAKVAGK